MKQNTKKIILLILTGLTLLTTVGFLYAISTGLFGLNTVEDTAHISSSNYFICILICAIANLISIFLIAKNIIAHKKKLIILNVIQLLFGTIFNVILGIANIILLSTIPKDIDEKIKEKKELPILEDITKYKWYIYLIIFVLLFLLCYTPITIFLPIPNTKTAAIIYLVSLYIIQVLGLVIPMFNELKRDFIVFKNNFKLYLGNMLKRFGIVSLVYFIVSFCILLLVKDIPNNQELLLNMPIYITAFLAIVVGPLTEELMFRGFIKKFIKNDTLFLILSSLIFGGLHVLSADSLQQLIFIIPYSLLGFAFSLNYVKTKNIVSNIFLHSAWNTLAVILSILTSL